MTKRILMKSNIEVLLKIRERERIIIIFIVVIIVFVFILVVDRLLLQLCSAVLVKWPHAAERLPHHTHFSSFTHTDTHSVGSVPH